ncbi:recombinase family protein [Escherichia coli]
MDMTNQPALLDAAAPAPTGMRFGYVRVSTTQQNPERQLAALIDLDVFITEGPERTLFTDKCSGSTTNRPELNALLPRLRSGDILHVHSIDRLGRDLVSCVQLVEQLKAKGVHVQLVKENITIQKGMPAMQDAMWQMMVLCAQLERAFMLERQAEGRERAKAKGTFKARGKGKDIDHNAIELALLKGEESIRAIAARLNVSPSTVLLDKKKLEAAKAKSNQA